MTVTCPICTMPRSFHPGCFSAALRWIAHGGYDAPANYDLARRLAPTCYLCGGAKATQVEHVIPKKHGGTDTWANIGGACQRCNRSKWHQPTQLTAKQQHRWSEQQGNYRAAWTRATADLVAAELLTNVKAESSSYPASSTTSWRYRRSTRRRRDGHTSRQPESVISVASRCI